MPRKPVSLGWGVRREGKSLWSRNANKGISVRGERRKRDGSKDKGGDKREAVELLAKLRCGQGNNEKTKK